jgi:hypothetical protein
MTSYLNVGLDDHRVFIELMLCEPFAFEHGSKILCQFNFCSKLSVDVMNLTKQII